MADDSIISYSDLIGDDGTFEIISKNIDKLKKELIDLAKLQKKAIGKISPNDSAGVEKMTKDVQELATAEKNLIKVEKALVTAKKKNIELTNEELIQREKEKLANRERIQIAKQTAILRRSEAGSIEALRAKLSLTTLEWKKLTAGELKNSKAGKNLVKQKKDLTDQLKKLEKQTGDTRRNVGNYTDSLGKLGKTAARVFVGRSIVDGLRRIGGAFSQLIQDGKDSNATLAKLDSAFSRVGTSLQNAGGKLLEAFTPAILFITNGLVYILDLFSGTTNGAKEFTATSEELKTTTAALNKEFVKESAELGVLFVQLGKTNEGSEERKGLIDKINGAYGKYLPNLLTEKSTLQDIAEAQRLANQELTNEFLLKIQKATLDDILTGKIKAQIKAFDELKGASKDAITGNVAQFNQLVENFNNIDSAASRSIKSIEGNIFQFDELNAKVAETDPALAGFIKSIRDLEPNARRVLIENIRSASNETKDYNDAIKDVNATISDVSASIVTYDHAVIASTGSIKANTAAIVDNREARLKAIEAIQKQLEDLETSNIEDKQARLLAIEELRFKEEQALKEIQFEKDKVLLQGREDELQALIKYNDGLKEQQEIAHQNKLLGIRKQFALATKDLETKNVLEGNDAVEELLNEKVQLVEGSNKKVKKSNKELIKSISDSASKVGEIIVGIFEKQADLSEKAVNSQVDNLDKAREQAQRGAGETLAFEEKELSKRQAEQQRRQKESEQAARLLSLFNLVSAYAANGDEQALTKAFVDFSLLTAFAAGIGFEEGGYTGDKGTKQIAGVVHGKEYVVTAADTAKYNLTGKSGEDFGSAMSDYYSPQSPVLQNPYKTQKESFEKSTNVVAQSSNKDVINELKAIKQQLANQPNISAEIVKMYEGVYGLVKEESRRNMKVITRTKLKERL